MIRKLLKDPVISVLIGVRQMGFGDIFAKSEMIAFGIVRLKDRYQIPKTCTVAKLPEHHRTQLVPTCEMLDILVTPILGDDSVELTSVQKCYELSKNIFDVIHGFDMWRTII